LSLDVLYIAILPSSITLLAQLFANSIPMPRWRAASTTSSPAAFAVAVGEIEPRIDIIHPNSFPNRTLVILFELAGTINPNLSLADTHFSVANSPPLICPPADFFEAELLCVPAQSMLRIVDKYVGHNALKFGLHDLSPFEFVEQIL
jgi:hypothetical protein